jgi:hypothetical protein
MTEQKPFFITLDGPQAHEHFGRDDKFVWGTGAPQIPPLRYRFGRDDKFVWGTGAPQIPPLRCASVGMTNLLEGRA